MGRNAAQEWKRYEVSIHGYGRRLITRDGPAQGLLEWPAHTWGTISTRPMGLKAAIALADAQQQHAVVTLWRSADVAHDNGKAPAVPDGWWPATAQTPAESTLMSKNPHAAALGRLGGSVKSERKTAAVRENARKPRPNAKGKKKPRRPKSPT